ncbi:hypothetical protein BGZ98_008292 [Dissophora globulifera]|nr:hypothetical protein BGZ98_008292 [Dissophora globulifera]
MLSCYVNNVLVLSLPHITAALGLSKDTTSFSLPLLGIPGGILLAFIHAGVTMRWIMIRVEKEEEMLKEYFEKEWDAYASKRWRFIPLVY